MTLDPKVKNLLSFLARFLFSAGLLFYLYQKIDVEKTVEVLRSAGIAEIVYALIIYIVIIFLLLARWWIFIRALGLKASLRDAGRFYFIGLFGNLFLPSSIGGDVIKILGLCRSSDQKPKVVASVILDRLSGFAGMVVAALAALALGRGMLADRSILLSVAFMTVVSATLGAVLFHEGLYSFACRIFALFPRLQQGLMKVHYDVALLKGRRYALYQAVGMSWFFQFLLALVFWWVARALHQDVPIFYFLLFTPLICVSSSVPSIGGLGAREAATAYLLAKVGVPWGIGVSISLINYFFMVLTGLAGGVVYAMTPAAKAAAASSSSEAV